MKNIYPEVIWKYFDEILNIPRLSKHEEEIIAYLEKFAAKHALQFEKDEVGNCLICKPASKGYESHQTVILQSHVDMVGEKLAGVEHDFSKDPITAIEKDGWLTAEGTTLGADDGIGIAASLAILESDSIEHGPLECLFTVDEETGMTGAFGLKEGFLKGKILLNLDSEDEGEIFIGCAGGIDTIATFQKTFAPVDDHMKALTVNVAGLQGGHSGDEIHKGLGNAIKVLTRMVYRLNTDFSVGLYGFSGGKLRNAIPREAGCKFVYQKEDHDSIISFLKSFEEIIRHEFEQVESGFEMTYELSEIPEKLFHPDFQKRLINSLYACPHGVIAWSKEIHGLVETSTNLAVIDDSNDEAIVVTTSQRSSGDTAKQNVADRIEALFLLAAASVRHSDGYPGWSPNKKSQVLQISKAVYTDLFGTAPEVKAIHAGLECGLFLTKYPDLDMISFGPTIKGAHTPDERIHIESVTKFWDFLLALLKQLP